MQIPIRMIGIATTFFWIFLIAFFISAVYSTKDVQFNFGNPQINATTNNEIIFSLPVSIANKGFYNIGSFKITTRIYDKEGSRIARGSTSVPIIRKDEEVTIIHNMTIDVNDLLQRDQNYLFNDTELGVYEAVSMSVAEAIPVQASTNFSMPWGAPLYNFTLGEIQFSDYNLTHVRVSVLISFENHAFFNVIGNAQVLIFNSNDMRVGEGQKSIEAYQNSFYSDYLELYVSITDMTESGHFEIYFQTPFFDYGPMVIPYG